MWLFTYKSFSIQITSSDYSKWLFISSNLYYQTAHYSVHKLKGFLYRAYYACIINNCEFCCYCTNPLPTDHLHFILLYGNLLCHILFCICLPHMHALFCRSQYYVRWLVYDHIWCVSFHHQFLHIVWLLVLILCSISSLTVFVYIQ